MNIRAKKNLELNIHIFYNNIIIFKTWEISEKFKWFPDPKKDVMNPLKVGKDKILCVQAIFVKNSFVFIKDLQLSYQLQLPF